LAHPPHLRFSISIVVIIIILYKDSQKSKLREK